MSIRTWESERRRFLSPSIEDDEPYPIRKFKGDLDAERFSGPVPSIGGRDKGDPSLPSFAEKELEERANEGLGRYSREAPKRGYDDAMRRYDAVLDERPDAKNHRGKTIHAVLAGLAGGAVGYANAGGRVRIKEPTGFIEEMQRPGYRRAMEDWSDKESKERERVKGSERLYRDAQRQDELDLRRKSTEAATKSSESRSEYWRRKGDIEEKKASQPQPKKREVHNTSGGLFERDEDGKLKKVPGTEPKAKPNPKDPEELRQRAKIIGIPEGSADWKYFMSKGELPAPARPRAGGGSNADKPKIAPPAEFGKVEDRKETALEKAETGSKAKAEELKIRAAAAEKKGDKATADRLRKEERDLWTAHESTKAGIQKRYEQGIVARGGSVAPKSKPAEKVEKPAEKAEKVEKPAPAQSKYKVGQRVKLRDGKSVIIEKINADGTFEYE